MSGVDVARPRVFGRYAIYDPIAAGGMATVHVGKLVGPAGFTRTVAIKQLHAQFAKDPEFVAMFLDEARLSARINHPNVIQTLDIVTTSEELFLVMEYVRGESLSRLLNAIPDKRLSPSMAITIMVGVLNGLHAAHEAKAESGASLNIVHRDVSPHNIVVGTDGVARVLDFGVAKAAGRIQTTRKGQLKGKIAYMAPEQLSGEATRVTDVYAASVVLWEALAGRRLFVGENQGEVLRKVLDEVIAPPSRHAEVPEALDAITLKGLARDPAKRFATARDMATALEDLGPLLTNAKIGAWVETVAAQTLVERERLLSRVEHDGSVADAKPQSQQTITATPTNARAKTMTYEIDGELGILVHSETAPSDEEWNTYISTMSAALAHAQKPRCLVVTDGDVAPSPKQRAAMNKLIAQRNEPVPTAVMTHSRTVRSVVTIMSWFNSGIRAFRMNELTEALDYLGVDPERRANVLVRIMRMRVEVSMQTSGTRAASDLARIAADMESLMNKRLPAVRDAMKGR